MQYLDPRSSNPSRSAAVPAVGELDGKTLGFLNNGWASMARIGRNIEAPLKARYGLSHVIFYDIPRSMAPPAACSSRLRGSARRPSSGWPTEGHARRGVSTTPRSS